MKRDAVIEWTVFIVLAVPLTIAAFLLFVLPFFLFILGPFLPR